MNTNKYKPMFGKNGDTDLFNKNNLAMYIFEPKFSGIRVFIYKDGNDIEIFDSLNRKITNKFPELLDVCKNIMCNSCVLDAELVLLNKYRESQELLELRILLDKKQQIDKMCSQFPAILFVFDILEIEGIEITNKQLRERKRLLDEMIIDSELIKKIHYSLDRKFTSEKKYYHTNGFMAKELGSLYESGIRSWKWLKLNEYKTAEAIVLGYKKNNGKDKKKTVDVILGMFDKRFNRWAKFVNFEIEDKARISSFLDLSKNIKIDKSLFDEEEIKKIKNNKKFNWLSPEIVLEFYYDEFKDNLFTNPKFSRIRFDKNHKSFLEN